MSRSFDLVLVKITRKCDYLFLYGESCILFDLVLLKIARKFTVRILIFMVSHVFEKKC